MAGKYHYISALAEMTAGDIVKNENEWTRFLTTAARLYKYPFNEQMLIYAQRPDATACASLETWNEKMNCWVNRGAKGIALIDTDSERPRLKYVFDVSDVHKARRIGQFPNLWEMREEAVKGITCIDLSRVSRVDTGGLALLLHLIDLAKKQGNNVTLQGVNDKVYTLAKLYNLPADVLPR